MLKWKISIPFDIEYEDLMNIYELFEKNCDRIFIICRYMKTLEENWSNPKNRMNHNRCIRIDWNRILNFMYHMKLATGSRSGWRLTHLSIVMTFDSYVIYTNWWISMFMQKNDLFKIDVNEFSIEKEGKIWIPMAWQIKKVKFVSKFNFFAKNVYFFFKSTV